jgi:glutathione-regulated potassium-efflux system protein KefB
VGQITLVQVAVLLAAAGLVAPLAKHFRIGAVLGYLFAGMVIGPFGLRIFSDADRMLHVAEFGVVLLLFLIGLELKPQRLLAMRKSVVGAGGTQVLVTAVALFAIVMAAGYDWRLALFVGLALSLSSTAMVLQVLKEKGELEHRHGRLGFAVLLFQDIAAIPMIAFVGLLAVNSDAAETMTWWGAIKALGALCAVVLAGRYIVGWVFHLIAKTGVSEAMTAFALLLIVVIEIIFKGAGLSPALGAFIAGALLAESAYRHEIEADIKPFESLLLGLFFVAVGMSLNLNLLISNPGSVMLAAAGLIVLKGIILFVIARRFGLDVGASRRFAVALAQGGEFAFVLTTGALAASVIMRDQAVFINIVVTVTMVATPLLMLAEGWLASRMKKAPASHQAPDDMPDHGGHVVIAGLGRFGQIIARVLAARGIPFTALDGDPTQIEIVLVDRLRLLVPSEPRRRTLTVPSSASRKRPHDQNDRHLRRCERMLAHLVVDLLVAKVGLDLQPGLQLPEATSAAYTRRHPDVMVATTTCSGANHSGKCPAWLSIRMPRNRSSEPTDRAVDHHRLLLLASPCRCRTRRNVPAG